MVGGAALEGQRPSGREPAAVLYILAAGCRIPVCLIAFCIAIIVCVAYCGWATWENCKPSNHRPTEYPEHPPAGYGQEPVFETPATGQIDQPVSAGYGHGGNWATATPVVQGTAVPPVASAPPVEQSSGWTWSKATPAQQANRFNM